jgi:hypothetical protein
VALVWAVPVVAAAVAAILVALAARPVGDATTALVDDLRRLRRVRESLATVRAAAADSEAVGGAFRRRHAGGDSSGPGDDDGAVASAGPDRS